MSKDYPVSPPRAWVEVDLDGLCHNLELARVWSGSELMVVIKAGAYGHGLERVAQVFARHQVAFIGVANVAEARRVRAAGVETPIYLLGPTWSGEREEVVAREWTACLSSIDEAAEFNRLAERAGKCLLVHLTVDTGMGRGGFLPADLPLAMERLRSMEHLIIDGIGSHLPSADEDEVFTRRQIEVFEGVIDLLGGVERFKWRHLLNSAGLIRYPGSVCNLARPGLMLYGVPPVGGCPEPLSTVMCLKSRITLIRTLPAGHGVSYGREYVTDKPTKVATVGAGYGDGYPRHLSGQGAEVFVAGRRCPVLGRVTMDQIMIDVTEVPNVVEGDEVELFGKQIPLAEVAAKAGTIAWEVLTGITPRVERCYFGEGGG